MLLQASTNQLKIFQFDQDMLKRSNLLGGIKKQLALSINQIGC